MLFRYVRRVVCRLNNQRTRRVLARCPAPGFRPRLEGLEERTLPAQVTWQAAAGGAWETPANWSSGSLPGPDDDVVISSLNPGATITHASDGTFIHSLNFNTAGTLNMNGGTLAVAVASTVDTGTTLNLNGGTLDGTGDWVVNGALNWTAGTMSGDGTTTVNGGLTLSGTSVPVSL